LIRLKEKKNTVRKSTLKMVMAKKVIPKVNMKDKDNQEITEKNNQEIMEKNNMKEKVEKVSMKEKAKEGKASMKAKKKEKQKEKEKKKEKERKASMKEKEKGKEMASIELLQIKTYKLTMSGVRINKLIKRSII
jgi:spore coat protein B